VNESHSPTGTAPSIRQRLAPWVPALVLSTAAVALGFGEEAARDLFRYERVGLQAGELWRLVTAHLVHLGWGHLLLNLAGLLLTRLLLDDALRTVDWFAASLAAALAIDAGLYFIAVGIDWYVGLSGVLHGLLAAGAVALLRPDRELVPERGDAAAAGIAPPRDATLGALLAAGLVAKLLWEQAVGPLPTSESASGGPVVVAAHLYGAAGGAAYALARRAVRRRSPASL